MINNKKKIKIGIVGTGPSSISVAKYFSSIPDIDLTIIDIGNTFKNYSKNHKLSLIPKKSFFGNFFMYQRNDKLKIIHKNNVDFDTSHALGGLSTVWGANVSYLNNIYFKKWNISPSKFLDAFKFVVRFMPHISINDEIDKEYDYKFNSIHFIKKPKFENKKKPDSNLSFGLSKLAINPKLCTKCSRCMEGCSYNAIFNSKDILYDLLFFRNITYKNNLQALRFVEKNKVIALTSKNLANGKTIEHQFDYLFIGAGVLDSTLIYSRSLGGNNNFKIKESKKF
jgi:ferredoxin